MWFRSLSADNSVLCTPAGRPDPCRAFLIPGRCGRPSVSSNLALAGRPHGTSEALSEVGARGASVSGLAGSASDSSRAAQARAPTTEQRPTGAVLRLCPSRIRKSILLAHRNAQGKGPGEPRPFSGLAAGLLAESTQDRRLVSLQSSQQHAPHHARREGIRTPAGQRLQKYV